MTEFNNRKNRFLWELDAARKAASQEAFAEASAIAAKPTVADESTQQTQPAAEQPKTQPKKKDYWFKDTSTVVERYLQRVHLVNLPKDFRTRLRLSHYEHHAYGSDFSVSFQTIDAIVKSCAMWRDYLENPEDFDNLVCLETCSMVEIHASVISARNFYEKQGAHGVHLKKDACPSELFTTVVTYDGSVKTFH